MTYEEIARIAHYANKAYCESLEDWSQPEWYDLSDEAQESVIKGTQFASLYPQASCEALHEEGRSNKFSDGWVYGLEKSDSLKVHPCLLPFESLPPEQKVKDELFKAVVQALL